LLCQGYNAEYFPFNSILAGRYVIVRPINSLYATGEFWPAWVGAFEKIPASSVKERVWRATF